MHRTDCQGGHFTFLPQYWVILWIVNTTTGKSRKAASTHINCITTYTSLRPCLCLSKLFTSILKTANMMALKCWLKPWCPFFVLAIITLGTRALYASCSTFLQHFFPVCDWSPLATGRFHCGCDLALPWHCAFINPELNRTWSILSFVCDQVGMIALQMNSWFSGDLYDQHFTLIVKMVQFVSILSH